MEENVALDSKKQKKFVKSIRGIKKLIKKNEGKTEPQKKDEKVEPQKPFSMKIKGGKVIKKKKRKERGLVYLSHIPHGFYEHQMTQYFKQFGVVTNARVIRSKRTGNSKGFAFVEFREPAVGQIVAETMNNYLMGKRLIKAAYIPPEKQKQKAFRKHWNGINNPGSQLRLKMKKAYNADKDENGELKRARKLLYNLTKNKKKLTELGINYGFFAPVDVPEALVNQVVKEEKADDDIVGEKSEPKKAKKAKKEQTENKTVDTNAKAPTETKSKNNKKQKNVKPAEIKDKPVEAKKSNKKENLPVKVNEKQQKEKEQKLKAAGVKPPAEFIKIGEDSNDESDSSYAFDSDEYEKVLDDDNSEEDLPDDSDDSGDDDEGSDKDESDSEEEEYASKEGNPVEAKIENVTNVDTNDKLAVTVCYRHHSEEDMLRRNTRLLEAIITAKLMEGDFSDGTYSPDPVEYAKLSDDDHPDNIISSDGSSDITISNEISEADESEEEETAKSIMKAVPQMQTRKRGRNQPLQIAEGKKQQQKQPPVAIKKKPQQPAASPKKPKFAKQNKKKPMKKQLRSK